MFITTAIVISTFCIQIFIFRFCWICLKTNEKYHRKNINKISTCLFILYRKNCDLKNHDKNAISVTTTEYEEYLSKKTFQKEFLLTNIELLPMKNEFLYNFLHYLHTFIKVKVIVLTI